MKRLLISVWVLILALILAVPVTADDTDVQHVKLDMEVDTVTQIVSATATFSVKSARNGLNKFSLRLHSNFLVTAVTCNTKPASYTRPTDAIDITLDRSYDIGQSFTVAATYSGRPSNQFYGSFQFKTHSGTPIVWSLSEPWYAYSWWACKESTVDKFTLEMWLTVSDQFVAASNGVLQGKDPLSGSRMRYRWKTDYPLCTYAVCLNITNYQIRTDRYKHLGADMPVEFYCYPESWSSSQGGMNMLVPMLTTFSNLFGQYPFIKEKYGIAQCGFGGGMEHQTLTAQGSFTSEFLNSHELAHSWWGNMITCATWKDIWLNEGFASYGEALWKEYMGGSSNKAALHSYMVTRRPRYVSGTVYCYDDKNPSRIFSSNYSYSKASWVVHQLRGVVGDVTFFKILSDYRTIKAYQSATTAEFEAIASLTYGKKLDWFIDQCVMNGGAPSYQYGWSHGVVNNKNYLYLHVVQTQDSRSYGLFKFPIEIRVNGTSFRVTNDNWRDEFVIPLTASPSSVLFDPDKWILWESASRVNYSPSFSANPATVPSTGGAVNLNLNAGAKLAGRLYLVGGSLTGIDPGIPLPGTPDNKTLPLTFDLFSTFLLYSVNSPMFQNFAGTLNASGQATAKMVLPNLGTSAIGLTACFAWLTTDAPFYTSIPVTVKIVN